jgi:uncharacterized protein (TIGR02679 family)
MTEASDERLQRLLGGSDLAELRKRIRRHFERANLEGPSYMLRLGELSAREYEVLASLMGRRMRHASSIRLDLAAIDMALSRAGIAPSLKSAIEVLDGPITHLPTARTEAVAGWSSVVEGAKHPDLARLLGSPKGLGLVKRLSKQDVAIASQLRERADLVLHHVPFGGRPRAQTAAEILGDAHALDDGQPTATLILAVLRQSELKIPNLSETDLLEEERVRTVWARAGVLVNELARPAMFLNVPVQGGATLMARAGEPGYASLRLLLRSPPPLAVAHRDVYICENPNLVAIAADEIGVQCAPLVCTDGMPAAAQRVFLTQLARAGAFLHYHGDFDWPGLTIANFVIRSFGAKSWRFCARDYVDHVVSPMAQRLVGKPAAAHWDSSLAPAMQARGLAIPEEAIAPVLLRDLQTSASSSST